MRKCRRCKSKPSLTDAEIKEMTAQVENMRGVRLAEDDEYKRRLDICALCEKFEYGTTCMLCGCIMQVRARIKDGKCPYPKNAKW